MNRNVLRGVLAGVLLFAVQAWAGSGPGFLARLGKLLGLDKRTLGSVSMARSSDRPTEGTYLLELDCAARTESVLWRCEGCRSPVRAGDAGIAVIRQDGLWLVEAPEKARRLVEGPGFISLLGLTPGGKKLAVVRERVNGGLPVVGLVDLGSGAFSEAPTQPTTQEEAEELRTLRPALIKGTQELSLVEPARQLSGPRQLRVTPAPGESKQKLCEFQPVPGGGAWDRFDPAWSGDKVIYVAGPLPASETK